MLGQKTEHLNPATLIGYKDVRQYVAVKNFSISPRPNLQADKVQPGHGGISLSARLELLSRRTVWGECGRSGKDLLRQHWEEDQHEAKHGRQYSSGIAEIHLSLLYCPYLSRYLSLTYLKNFPLPRAYTYTPSFVYSPHPSDTMTKEPQDLQIAILGAGMGGLTSALALAQQGFKNIDVYENASDLGFVGAGIQLAPNMARVLDGLGVWKGVEGEAVNIEETSVRGMLKVCQCNSIKWSNAGSQRVQRIRNMPMLICAILKRRTDISTWLATVHHLPMACTRAARSTPQSSSTSESTQTTWTPSVLAHHSLLTPAPRVRSPSKWNAMYSWPPMASRV
jgi:hypothetical protein